jgi:hypothetical protein
VASNARTVLADSGFFIGWFDPRDAHHERCAEFAKRFPGVFVTSWSVFTEVCALLSGRSLEHFFAWADAAQTAGILRIENPPASAISEIWRWMQRYDDLPMDFCDASLVVIAVEQKLQHIATTDVRDFTVYRLPNRKRFVHVLS